jgi:hypothetical protein
MSLKVFHIVFITASTLLAFGFGGWSLTEYFTQGGLSTAILGFASVAAGLALIWYGRAILKKFRWIDL